MLTRSLNEVLDAWALRDPDRVALRGENAEFTTRELVSLSRSCAGRFQSLGVRRGDPVIVIGDSSTDWAIAALGVLRAGGVLCGVTERSSAAELAELLPRVQPALVVHGKAQADTVEAALVQSGHPAERCLLDGLPSEGGHAFQEVAVQAADLAFVSFTSGSTGRPKGVTFSHESVLGALFEWSLQAPAFLHGKLLLIASFGFTGGVLWFLGQLAAGGEVVILGKWNPGRALELVERHEINSLTLMTIHAEQMAREPAFDTTDLSRLTFAMVGGSPVSRDLLAAWARRGVRLRQAYGMSESGSMVTLPPFELAGRDPSSVGYGGIVTAVEVRGSDGGRVTAPGSQGEIVVRGPGTTPGYWRDPELTEAVIVDGWLHTGDIGEIAEDGALRIVGRIKDVIDSGGMRIYPAELERVIRELDGVIEVAVLGVEHETYGETPAAVVYARDGLREQDVIEHCRARLARYKTPSTVVLAREPLAQSAADKFDKPALRARYLLPDERAGAVQ